MDNLDRVRGYAKKVKRKVIATTLPNALYDRISKMAEEEDVSTSNLVRDIIKEHIKSIDENAKKNVE